MGTWRVTVLVGPLSCVSLNVHHRKLNQHMMGKLVKDHQEPRVELTSLGWSDARVEKILLYFIFFFYFTFQGLQPVPVQTEK